MRSRSFTDAIAGKLFGALTWSTCALAIFIVAALFFRSWDILQLKPLSTLLFSSGWHPMDNEFGFYPFIMGTVWVTTLAMVIAVPVCVLSAIYLSEYAHQKVKDITASMIDLLAGIPSVVYGVWGVIMIVPLVGGYCTLAAGIVLAIMVMPIIISVLLEVFRTVPHDLKDASLSVGATKWQTIKFVLLRKSLPGLVAAIILGFSRAFGETMAVLMVAGNVPIAPKSVFDPAYPLPALIANNYGEMMSIPMYDSALMFAALLLLLMVLAFNMMARFVLFRMGVE